MVEAWISEKTFQFLTKMHGCIRMSPLVPALRGLLSRRSPTERRVRGRTGLLVLLRQKALLLFHIRPVEQCEQWVGGDGRGETGIPHDGKNMRIPRVLSHG